MMETGSGVVRHRRGPKGLENGNLQLPGLGDGWERSVESVTDLEQARSLVPMKVTLAETYSTGDMEPEVATSSSHARPLCQRIDQKHQPTHKIFDPKFFLSKRNARTVGRAKTEGVSAREKLMIPPKNRQEPI